MANELTRPLTDAEERLWQEKLAALLVRQIALYTANESSSVPAAAARELLRGVLFFLAVPEEPEASSQPEDVGSRYEADRAARIRTLLSCDLANALARTLLGGEGLTLSDGEIGALRERWEHARPERIENDLLTAADALAERLILPRDAGKYLSGFAREVTVRAESLRDCGGLRGVFV